MKKIYILLLIIYPLAISAFEGDALYEQGMKSFESGNYGSAELIFRRVVNSTDNHVVKDRAWFHLARSVFEQEKYNASLLEFNRFLNTNRTPALASEARFWIAESNFHLDNQIRAVEEYKRFVEQSREDKMRSRAHERIAAIYFKQNRFDEAVMELERAITLSEDSERNARLVYLSGKAHFENNRISESQNRLTPLLTSRADPRTISLARIIIARGHQAKGEHSAAIRTLNGIPDYLIKEKPFYDAKYFTAKSNISLNEKNSARMNLNLFLLIGRDSQWYYHALYESALLKISEGKNESAIEDLERVRNNSDKPELVSKASKELSRIYMEKDPDKAFPFIEESLKSMEGTQEYRNNILILSRKYIERGETEKAAPLLAEYKNLYPFDKHIDEVYFLLGRKHIINQNFDKAEENFTLLKENHPFSGLLGEVLFHEAEISYKTGKYSLAIRQIQQYLKKRDIRNRYPANVILLDSYIAEQNTGNAHRTAENIKKNFIDQKDVEKPLLRFAVYFKNRGGNAGLYFDQIINSFPGSKSAADAYYILAADAYKNKQLTKALEFSIKYIKHPEAETEKKKDALYTGVKSGFSLNEFEQVVSLHEKNGTPSLDEERKIEVLGLIARSYVNLYKYPEAYDLLEKENIKNFKNPVILAYIKSSLNVGKLNTAVNKLPLLKDDQQNYGKALISVSEKFIEENRLSDAEKHLLEFVENITEDKDKAFLLLAELYFKKKDYRSTIRNAEKVKDKDLKKDAVSYIIISLFNKGEDKEAYQLSRKNINALNGTPESENIFLKSAQMAFAEKDPDAFDSFASRLGNYSGYDKFITYHRSELFYIKGDYEESFKGFKELAYNENPYRLQSLQRKAAINLFVKEDTKAAEKNLLDLIEDDSGDIREQNWATINLAILYADTGRTDKAENLLSELHQKSHGLVSYQSGNLIENLGEK